jgi:uncharacterized protein (TIGR02145 family)
MKRNKLILSLFITITVMFTACGPEKVYVNNVVLNIANLQLEIGDNEKLDAAIHPANADNQNVIWRSNNPSIATIDENGLITAVAQGTATIEITTECGAKTARCVVTVTQPVESITLNKASITLLTGRTETLTVTVAPTSATNRNVTWSSSNQSVATVDITGKITAITAGTATITVTTTGNDVKTATCTVTVVELNASNTGVVINNVRWATRNVDRVGTFAQRPEDTGMIYQWNRRTAWSAASSTVTGWNSTPATGTVWTRLNDPCPTGWRVPTQSELFSLRDAGSNWTTHNGVSGRFFGTFPNQIFLPAVGKRDWGGGGLLLSAGGEGNYWSSTQDLDRWANCLRFNSNSGDGSAWLYRDNRANGHSVRCVAE